MSSEPATAIIGGGIIGTCIAWRLAQRGHKVVLFEKSEIGGEATWAAAGMLSPGGEIDEHSTHPEMYVEGRSLYRSFIEELTRDSGIAIDYQEGGAIELAYTEDEWQALLRRAARQAELGIQSRPLTRDKVGVFSPYVERQGLAGALFYPGDGVVAPRDVTQALRIVCANHGVEFRDHTPVHEIFVCQETVAIQGEQFPNAVVAAGAWSGQIVVQGAPPLPASEPVKGHLLAFNLQLGACPTIVRRGSTYLFQRRSGLLVAGASVERIGFERGIDSAVSDRLFHEAAGIFPVLEKLQPVDVWTGFRPASAALQVGRWHNTPLFLAYGHYRNGILLAPYTAQRIAAEVSHTLTAAN